MGKPKASSIDVPDPLAIIEAEKNANRTGVRTPFGSSRWEGDTQVTEFGPQMQGMTDRMFDLGMQDSQRPEMPDFMGEIASGIMSNVGDRYGVNKPKPGTEPPPQFAGPAERGYSGEMQMQPPQTPPPPQMPPSPGYMPPTQMDPGQLEQLRRSLGGGNNQFFGQRQIR